MTTPNDHTDTETVDSGIRIAHASPGRIRFKIAQIRENAEFADKLQQRLASLQGVRMVETNSLTGSVLILYDPTVTPSPKSLRTLIEPLAALFPGVVLQEL